MSDPLDILVAIDALDDLVHNAKPMPMTDDVRFAPEALREHVDAVLDLLPPGTPGQLADELQAIVAEAKPVPLTSQVRVGQERVYELLDRLRSELPEVAFRARYPAGKQSPLHHVALEVRESDADAAVAFWALLGFTEVAPPGSLRARSRWVQRDGAQIHLLFTAAPIAPREGHVALVLGDDYEQTLARLAGAGFAADPRTEHWGSPRAFLGAPGGHRVEVMRTAPS